MSTNTEALKLGLKLGSMRMFNKYINAGEAVQLCDQLRAEIERLQTQDNTASEQMQLYAHFTTIKSLIKADTNKDLFIEIANTMRYINECEQVAERDIVAYIKEN